MSSQNPTFFCNSLTGGSLFTEAVRGVEVLPSHLSSADLEEDLQTILEQLSQHVACDASVLFLLTGEKLSVAASKGLPDPAKVGEIWFDLSQQPRLKNLLLDEKAVISPDVLKSEPFRGASAFTTLHACLAAPMLYQGKPVGLLIGLKEEPDFYSEEDAQLAMTFASQAAMAIENARLYGETRRRAIQLELANQVSKKAASILNLDELLFEVVRLIKEKIGFYQVHIFLVDGHSNEIVMQEMSGEAEELLRGQQVRLRIGEQGITGWVAGTGEPLICNDVSKESRYHPHELLPRTQSEAALPMRVGDVVVGVLDVQSDTLNAFLDDDITTLQILADQIAIAIENTHLFQATRRQVDTLRTLHDISLNITSHLESDVVLHTILEQASRLLNAQGSTLGIYDPEINVVHIVSGHNVPPGIVGVDLEIGEGVAGEVIAKQKPVFVNDYRSWENGSPKFDGSPFTAVLGVPLRWQDQVIGDLVVLDIKERRTFTESDAELLAHFADLSSIALKKAELFEEVKQTGELLEQQVAQRTRELSTAKQELANKADQLKRLLRETVNIQEEERSRIAKDLHDGSNQLITGTLLEIQAAQQSIQDQRIESALEKLETAKRHLRRLESENRRIITGLHPIMLDSKGLVPALRWQLEKFQEQYGISSSLNVSGKAIQLSSESERAIYRIVQEALNNIAAHAKAKRVHVGVKFHLKSLVVIIVDDGQGFDLQAALEAATTRMGLVGMQERVESIGGHIEIQTTPGQGTRITLEVPIRENRLG